MPQAHNFFLTRLHLRYGAAHFSEDLLFQESSGRNNFHARYIVRYPWTGMDDCTAATVYRQQLRDRYEREAHALASLTGWSIGEIRKALNLASLQEGEDETWHQRLWTN